MDIEEIIVTLGEDFDPFAWANNFDNTVNWRNAIDSTLSNAGSDVLSSNTAATAADVLYGSGASNEAIELAIRDAAFKTYNEWLRDNEDLSHEERKAGALAILNAYGITNREGLPIDAESFDYRMIADKDGMIGRDVTVTDGDGDSGGSPIVNDPIAAAAAAAAAAAVLNSRGSDSPDLSLIHI